MRSPEIPSEVPSNPSTNQSANQQAKGVLTPVVDDGSLPGVGQRQVVLNKQGTRYIFRYSVGQEASFLKGIETLANSSESNISWFDAAVLSHQMGQRLGQDLRQLKRA